MEQQATMDGPRPAGLRCRWTKESEGEQSKRERENPNCREQGGIGDRTD